MCSHLLLTAIYGCWKNRPLSELLHSEVRVSHVLDPVLSKDSANNHWDDLLHVDEWKSNHLAQVVHGTDGEERSVGLDLGH